MDWLRTHSEALGAGLALFGVVAAVLAPVVKVSDRITLTLRQLLVVLACSFLAIGVGLAILSGWLGGGPAQAPGLDG